MKEQSSQPVLITGSSGFIGAALASALINRQRTVIGLDMRPPAPELTAISGYTHLNVDIRDSAAVLAAFDKHKPEGVAHLAAMHMIPECENNPEACYALNVRGTQNVTRAARKYKIDWLGFTSSADVYASTDEPKSTYSPTAPTTVYGRSKLEGEAIVKRELASTSTRVLIFRPFNVYGPGDNNPHIIPSLIRRLDESTSIAVGNMATVRDYVFVSDVAQYIADKLLTETSGTFNVGTGVPTSGTQLLEELAIAKGITPEVHVSQALKRTQDRPVLVAGPHGEGLHLERETTDLAQGLRVTVEQSEQKIG